MLEKASALRALNHLTNMGDTDIFPAPFEFRFYAEKSEEIVSAIATLDTSQYTPRSCAEILSPKGALSFRIAHQLYPADTLLYTTAVVQIAPSLEALRQPVSNGAFSYRFIEDPAEVRLFAESSSYHDWLLHLKDVFTDSEPFSEEKHVIETDISDFYSRIYFHRLEHVLDDCAAPNAVRKIIEGVIKFSRARQSYGLPVGTAASRLLAEGLLNDTDKMLSERATAYSRYVDDFRIVLDNQKEVHSVLCALAAHLMMTEGLSLNASKTRTYTTEQALETINHKLSDVFSDDAMASLSRYIRQTYEDEEVSADDIEEVDPVALTDKLRELLARDAIDYAAVRVILKAVRVSGHPSAMIFLEDFSELLYYVPRDFCLLIGALAERNPDIAIEMADKLVALAGTSPFADMPLCKIWIAHLFSAQALPITRERLGALDLRNTTAERRYQLILRGILNDRSYFRSRKTSFDEASDWEKAALMLGASCLSTGEYATWLDTIKQHYQDPFADLYRKWLKDNQSNVFEKLKVQFAVKSRADRLREALLAGFTNLDAVADDDAPTTLDLPPF